MAEKNTNKKDQTKGGKDSDTGQTNGTKGHVGRPPNNPETNFVRNLILGIFLILFGALFALGLFGSAGIAGAGLKNGAKSLLGYGAFLLPLGLIGAG